MTLSAASSITTSTKQQVPHRQRDWRGQRAPLARRQSRRDHSSLASRCWGCCPVRAQETGLSGCKHLLVTSTMSMGKCPNQKPVLLSISRASSPGHRRCCSCRAAVSTGKKMLWNCWQRLSTNTCFMTHSSWHMNLHGKPHLGVITRRGAGIQAQQPLQVVAGQQVGQPRPRAGGECRQPPARLQEMSAVSTSIAGSRGQVNNCWNLEFVVVGIWSK